MTTITIRQDIKNLTKTEFADLDELAEFMLEYIAAKDFPELTQTEIKEAENAKEKWHSQPQKFRRVTTNVG